MYYRDILVAHEWKPVVPPNLEYVKNERQWLILGNKLAFLHVYIACHNYTNDGYIQWNEDLFHLIGTEAVNLRRQGFCVFAMGDFNTRVGKLPGLEWNDDVVNPNYNQFLNFIDQVNMIIINTLPVSKGHFTRFMDSQNSKSLIDFSLVDSNHVNNVTSFIIDENSRFDCGSDHALLECTIQLHTRPTITWKFKESIKYNINDNTNYTKFREALDEDVGSVSLSSFSKMNPDDMLPHLVKSMNDTARNTLGPVTYTIISSISYTFYYHC